MQARSADKTDTPHPTRSTPQNKLITGLSKYVLLVPPTSVAPYILKSLPCYSRPFLSEATPHILKTQLETYSPYEVEDLAEVLEARPNELHTCLFRNTHRSPSTSPQLLHAQLKRVLRIRTEFHEIADNAFDPSRKHDQSLPLRAIRHISLDADDGQPTPHTLSHF